MGFKYELVGPPRGLVGVDSKETAAGSMGLAEN
jgi:hypothetical protein